MMRVFPWWLLVVGLVAIRVEAEPPSLEALAAEPLYEQVKLSPDGKHLAALVQIDGRRNLVVLDRTSKQSIAAFHFGKANTGFGVEEMSWFRWLNNDKLLFDNVNRNSYNDVGRAFGELYVGDIRKRKMLTLFSARRGGPNTISVEDRKEQGSATFLAKLPDDENHILITVWPWRGARFVTEVTPSVYRANIENGNLEQILKGPMPGARFLVGADGNVRYAYGTDAQYRQHIYERLKPGSTDHDWHEIAINGIGAPSMQPEQVSADGKTLYYYYGDGTQAALIARDLETGQETELIANMMPESSRVEYDAVSGRPLWISSGTRFEQTHYFEPNAPASKAHRALLKALAPAHLRLTSQQQDSKEFLFRLSYDREPGSYYLFNTVSKKAELFLIERPQLQPDQLIMMTAIELNARDGVRLKGYFTAEKGLATAKQPMVVLVHGGPYGIYDGWWYDSEVQLLATRGYGVLQINFRGSGGRGQAFEESGYRQWGGKMQDDVTDATRWAIEQGLADPARICIMGSSYGGYASLMGAIKEPELYRCAISMAGVSDLELMFDEGDIIARSFGEAYLQQALGDDKSVLAARSPTKQATRIKAPVLLMHGGQDERVPIEHAEAMEAALKKHGKSVETFYIDTEGHGFFLAKNRVRAYQTVLDFLGRHIGQAQAGALQPPVVTVVPAESVTAQ